VNPLIPTLAGWLLGFLSAYTLEGLRQRRRLTAIRHALVAELQRLRTELFHLDDELVDVRLDMDQNPTTIHPWVQRLVADAAEIHPSLVSTFLQIDLQLRNLAVLEAELARVKTQTADPEVAGSTHTTKAQRLRHLRNQLRSRLDDLLGHAEALFGKRKSA